MDLGLLLSVASFMVAVAAMIFSVLYSGRAVRIAQASNSIHVIADMFTEVRSREFRALYRTVLEEEYPTDLPNGLASLEKQDQDDIFQLCAYFEHMGALCYSGWSASTWFWVRLATSPNGLGRLSNMLSEPSVGFGTVTLERRQVAPSCRTSSGL